MLAGKVLVMVEAVSHRPLWQDYTEDALPHDKRLAGRFWRRYHQAACWSLIWEVFQLSMGRCLYRGCQVFCDATAGADSLSDGAAPEQQPILSRRNHPDGAVPRQPVSASVAPRFGPVAGGVVPYLTNVHEPQELSARQVCALYRCQWRIADAFAQTKRRLHVAHVWTGRTMRCSCATLMFYAVLLTICP